MALVQITENTLRAFLADAEIAAFDSAGAEGITRNGPAP